LRRFGRCRPWGEKDEGGRMKDEGCQTERGRLGDVETRRW
jgi:hypothetical protein